MSGAEDLRAWSRALDELEARLARAAALADDVEHGRTTDVGVGAFVAPDLGPLPAELLPRAEALQAEGERLAERLARHQAVTAAELREASRRVEMGSGDGMASNSAPSLLDRRV